MGKNKIQPLKLQSLLDLAVQTSGDAEGVISLAKVNGVQITDPIDMRKLIKRGEEIDRRRMQYYRRMKIKPATEIVIADIDDGGIFGDEFSDEFE